MLGSETSYPCVILLIPQSKIGNRKSKIKRSFALLRMTVAQDSYRHFPDLCRAALIRSPTGFHSIQSCRLISM